MSSNNSRLIIPLDFSSLKIAMDFVESIDPSQCKVKVGKELFTSAGPQVIADLKKRGFDIFLDLKFHDIPNTVAKACQAACALGVWMMNVHTLGGIDMMRAAVDAIENSGHADTLLIGVTVLTSHNQASIEAIGLQGSIEANVLHLARLAKKSGLKGVVCSAQEVSQLKKLALESFLYITPGIRPKQASVNDQSRVMTPYDAIIAGSSYLVMGRPITQAADPMKVIQSVNVEIEDALASLNK